MTYFLSDMMKMKNIILKKRINAKVQYMQKSKTNSNYNFSSYCQYDYQIKEKG